MRLLVLAAAIAVCCNAQPAFEVASIRVKADHGLTSVSPFGSNRFTADNASLAMLVELAYDVPPEQIAGIEKLGSEQYDVAVKAEDGVTLSLDQIRPRFQRLLTDRFKLRTHHETKALDAYALTVAKGGPRLGHTKGVSSQGEIFPGGLHFTNIPLSTFAALLRTTAGRPVVDRTGIEGSYDFDLRFSQTADADSTLPSFFTALQEKYGLRLETTKAALDVLVIDAVEKIPTEN